MKEKVLVAGGGYADIPLIRAAHGLGYYVISSGNRPGELGHSYSDEYQSADYSDPEAILALAKKNNVRAIIPCCNDFSALSSAYSAERMGLPGHDSHEVSKILHHKDRFRQWMRDHDLPSPKFISVGNVREALEKVGPLTYPLIVKPVDLTGGKGIRVVRSAQDFTAAVDRALTCSRLGRAVIEEYLDGTYHGLSAILVEHHVVFYFSDNEHYYLNPFMVSAASAPSNLGPKIEKEICDQIETIARALGLVNGIFHAQTILHKGNPIILEACRRAPGDLYVRWVELATGVPYAQCIVRGFLGMDLRDLRQVRPQGFSARHCVMSARAGCVRDVAFHPSIKPHVKDSMMWWTSGGMITDVLNAKLGIVFLEFDSEKEMLDKMDRMQEFIRVEVVSEGEADVAKK